MKGMKMVERRMIIVVHHEDGDLGDPRGAMTVAGCDLEAFLGPPPTANASCADCGSLVRVVPALRSGGVENWVSAVAAAPT
jgi:hypothetical protein